LEKGTILFHTEFKFSNGETGEKLLIILNDPVPAKEPYLICRTTSQPGNKPKTPGCIAKKSLFFIASNQDFFIKDTWIQLYEIYSFEASEFLKDKFDGKLEIKGNLKELTIRQLLNCIRIIEDISAEHKKMILKK
jgi:hypothetical protein